MTDTRETVLERAGIPLIECEEGYPTDESIAAFRSAQMTVAELSAFMVTDFAKVCAELSCCSVTVGDATDEIYGPSKIITFTTGGWSGAEDLISAILEKPACRLLYQAWKRGGWYRFVVPHRYLTALLTEGQKEPGQ